MGKGFKEKKEKKILHKWRSNDLNIPKKWMSYCRSSRDAVFGFVDEQSGQQIARLFVELKIGKLLARPVRKRALVVGQLGDAGPCLLVWRAENAEYLKELIDLRVAAEEHSVSGHLVEDATDAPDVNFGRVVFAAEQNFGRTVPERDDFVSERANWYAERSSQAEIGELDVAV